VPVVPPKSETSAQTDSSLWKMFWFLREMG
jgi:hypothetical protein